VTKKARKGSFYATTPGYDTSSARSAAAPLAGLDLG
jgi:hypothetical protein